MMGATRIDSRTITQLPQRQTNSGLHIDSPDGSKIDTHAGASKSPRPDASAFEPGRQRGSAYASGRARDESSRSSRPSNRV